MKRYLTGVNITMLKTAEDYIATVDRQEGVYLLSLFPKANYDVFMHTVSSVLSELVDLEIGFPERLWPLHSGINPTSVRPSQSPSNRDVQGPQRGRSLDRGSPCILGKENISPLHLNSPPKRPTSRSRLLNRPLFKSPARSPSRKSDRTPPRCKKMRRFKSSLGLIRTPILWKKKYHSSSTTETAPLKASLKQMPSLFILLPPAKFVSIPKDDDLPTRNFDFNICYSLADYILHSEKLHQVEGIFRKSGSASRVSSLYLQLYDHFETEANMVRTLDNPQGPHEYSMEEARRSIAEMLREVPPHDVTGVLLRSLVALHSNDGLLHREITELLLKATRLQYALKEKAPFYSPITKSDWSHHLCHGRQLLTYRIVIQFLLPKPERVLLLTILSALHAISLNSETNLMSSAALARCLFNTLLGCPEEPGQVNQYIDTLINLIELSEELEALPKYLYEKVKEVLDGDSDISENMMKLLNRKPTNDLDTILKKRSWVTTEQICFDATTTTSVSRYAPPVLVDSSNAVTMPACTPIRRTQTPLVANTLISTPTSGLFLRNGGAESKTLYQQHEETVPRPKSPFGGWQKKRQQQQQKQQSLGQDCYQSVAPSPKKRMVKSKSVTQLLRVNVKSKFAAQ